MQCFQYTLLIASSFTSVKIVFFQSWRFRYSLKFVRFFLNFLLIAFRNIGFFLFVLCDQSKIEFYIVFNSPRIIYSKLFKISSQFF